MTSPRRRLNFENVQISPRRLERAERILAAANEFHRLARLNLNSFTPRIQSQAAHFMHNVIEGAQGNWNALNRAVAALPNVRRIGGGNISPRRASVQHRAATKIQARARGIAGRKRAAARGTKLVVELNGTIHRVAVPLPRRR